MIFSKPTITMSIENDLISVKSYFNEQQLRPFGLRVHLSNQILVPSPNQRIDLSSQNICQPRYESMDIKERPLLLKPGDFVLGSTVERIRAHPTVLCRIDGRSTLARLGVMVHAGSEIFDNNYVTHKAIVPEIHNASSMEITIPYLLWGRYGNV